MRRRRGRRRDSRGPPSPSRPQHSGAAAVRVAEPLAIDEQADVLDPAHRDAAGDAPSSAPVPRGVTGRAHAGTGRVLRAPGFAAWNASATAHTGDLPEMEHRKSYSRRPRHRESVGGTTTFVVVRDA